MANKLKNTTVGWENICFWGLSCKCVYIFISIRRASKVILRSQNDNSLSVVHFDVRQPRNDIARHIIFIHYIILVLPRAYTTVSNYYDEKVCWWSDMRGRWRCAVLSELRDIKSENSLKRFGTTEEVFPPLSPWARVVKDRNHGFVTLVIHYVNVFVIVHVYQCWIWNIWCPENIFKISSPTTLTFLFKFFQVFEWFWVIFATQIQVRYYMTTWPWRICLNL